MCTLAGISLKKNESIQGRLPKAFGGNDEREYTITESLHPGDPYQAEIVTKDYYIHFVNGSNVKTDGRVELKDYTITITTRAGKLVKNAELERKYTELVLDHIKRMLIYG